MGSTHARSLHEAESILPSAPAFHPLGKMFGKGGHGGITCGVLGIMGVLSNGLYALCGIGNHIPELVFGDASKDALEDVWENTPVLNELREGIPDKFKGICGNCLMNNFCFGSCIAKIISLQKIFGLHIGFAIKLLKRDYFLKPE